MFFSSVDDTAFYVSSGKFQSRNFVKTQLFLSVSDTIEKLRWSRQNCSPWVKNVICSAKRFEQGSQNQILRVQRNILIKIENYWYYFFSKVLDSAKRCLDIWEIFWSVCDNFSSGLSKLHSSCVKGQFDRKFPKKKCTLSNYFSDVARKVFSFLATSFRERCQICNLRDWWDTLTQKGFFGNLKIHSIILRLWAIKRLGKRRINFRGLVNNAIKLSRGNVWGKKLLRKF